MIASLNGKLILKDSTTATVECGGVGYLVNITVTTSESLPKIGEQIFFHIVYQLREDSVNLFGFISESEKSAFLLLNSVSGIGGKTALGILSSVSVNDLVRFITHQNLAALQKLPGIGKKTAERLCFELKEKIIMLSDSGSISGIDSVNNTSVGEAISALVSLGYSRNVAEKSVKAAQSQLGDTFNVESLIKNALKFTMM
ncbi:Holliday junction branch migration protein RuvA [Candidatus Kapaibacterium sp.]